MIIWKKRKMLAPADIQYISSGLWSDSDSEAFWVHSESCPWYCSVISYITDYIKQKKSNEITDRILHGQP